MAPSTWWKMIELYFCSVSLSSEPASGVYFLPWIFKLCFPPLHNFSHHHHHQRHEDHHHYHQTTFPNRLLLCIVALGCCCRQYYILNAQPRRSLSFPFFLFIYFYCIQVLSVLFHFLRSFLVSRHFFCVCGRMCAWKKKKKNSSLTHSIKERLPASEFSARKRKGRRRRCLSLSTVVNGVVAAIVL